MTDVFTMRATGGGAAGKVDRGEVKRAALVLFDPALGVQIQQLSGRDGPAPHKIVKGDDLDGIVKAVEELNSGIGVYWGINPCAVGREKPINAEAIVYRRWLLVDCDPVRPADSNGTDDEHDAAQDVAYRAMEYLTEKGWPLPVIIDSGNGWHLLYRLDDMPNDDLSKSMIGKVLKHLAGIFDNQTVTIDPKMGNANRLGKLPGTQARKGPETDERPHRMVRMVFVPEPTERVTVEQLKIVIGVKSNQANGAPKPTEQRSDPFTLHANGTDDASRLRSYARAALEREEAKVALCPAGQRNNTLNTAAFSLGTLVGAGMILEQEVEERLIYAACRAGLADSEARKTVKSGLAAGKAKPREIPQKPAEAKPNSAAPKKSKLVVVDPGVIPDGPLIVRASKVAPRKVRWLWPGRIPLGKMTTFAGPGGIGKTFCLLDIASRVSRGMDWPDSAGVCCDPGQVLFVSGEDDPDDTLVPRLIAMGADLDRIGFLSTPAQTEFTLKALQLLTAAMSELGDDTRLVVIDPPTSYLDGADDHKNAELRSLLTPLKEWTARANTAIVFITHVNKGSGHMDAAMRIIGSVAWSNAVRATHMFAEDPDDNTRSLFCPVKLNVGRKGKALAYRIKPEVPNDYDGPATVEWLGEVDTTANQAMGPKDKNRKRMVVASDWLIERFREKLEWKSDELFEVGREEGVSRSAIYEAKTQLNLPNARRRIYENGDVAFVWWVPEDWPRLAFQSPPRNTETRETGGGKREF